MPDQVSFDLANSIRFDPDLRLRRTEDDFVRELAEAIVEASGAQVRQTTITRTEECVSCLLANIYMAQEHGVDVFVAISRTAGDYTTSRYWPKPLSYRTMTRVLDFIVENSSAIDFHRGFSDGRSGLGRLSRLRLAPEQLLGGSGETSLGDHLPLDGERTDQGTQRECSGSIDTPTQGPTVLRPFITRNKTPTSIFDLSRLMPKELVRLKDEQKRLVDYTETDQTRDMRSQLGAWNSFCKDQWLDLFLPDDEFRCFRIDGRRTSAGAENSSDFEEEAPERLDFVDVTRKYLYRVFNNGSFDFGGRLYGGWWQSIPSRYRKFVTVNGHPTVELDFKGMQISMLYAQRGMQLSDDPYDVEGLDRTHRNLVKKIFLQLINATDGQPIRPPNSSDMPEGWSFAQIREALCEKHAPISECFGSGVGLELQREDAEIALNIMGEMQALGELVLPVHDSFIARDRASDLLEDTMLSGFSRYYGEDIEVTWESALADDYTDVGDLDSMVPGEDWPPHVERLSHLYHQPQYSEYRARNETWYRSMDYEGQMERGGLPFT